MRITSLSKVLLLGGFTVSAILFSTTAQAAAFQLYEQDAASLGDAHAGIVASDSDSAADNFYNPAALIRLKSQQITTGTVEFNTSMRYYGTVNVSTINPDQPVQAVKNGGGFASVPNFHYAIPINDRWAAGFSIVTPFGLQTNYRATTYLRYAATKTSMRTVDLTPALSFKVNKWFSVGAGFDAVHLNGIFNQYAGLVNDYQFDTRSTNTGSDWGYGYHLGMLFQFTPHDRLGLAYHSQIVNHMGGLSKFQGPLANGLQNTSDALQESGDLRARVVLPPYTTLSYFHQFNSQWAAMSSVQYTQWDIFKNLYLQNIASINGTDFSPTTQNVLVMENYQNSWNFALGMHYSPIQQITLKLGTDFDETPSKTESRNVQLPDQSRLMLNAGIHWQIIKKIGMDFGYSHIYFRRANIYGTQSLGAESVTTDGYSRNFANLYGLQLTYNI